MEESAARPVLVGYFVWEPPARDIAILLNLELVDRLQKLIHEAPDIEIGGVLLGRCQHDPVTSDRHRVTIDDFEPIQSEHLRGPAFILSQHDQKALDKSLSRPQGRGRNVAVGFFRSHLRKGLYLDKADFSLFRDYFSAPCCVFLAARPEPAGVPAAGFFYWQGESLHRQTTYTQFPLDRKKLETGGYLILGSRSVAPSESVPPVAVPLAARTQPQPRRVRVIANRRMVNRLVYGAIGALLILTAVLLAILMRSGGGAEEASTASLNVQRERDGLRLTWDPRSAPIEHAANGILLITDGGKSRRVELESDGLKRGNYLYTPESSDVNFRLDLGKRQRSESVRFVAEKEKKKAPASPEVNPVAAKPPPPPPVTPQPMPQMAANLPPPAKPEVRQPAPQPPVREPQQQAPPPVAQQPTPQPPPQSTPQQVESSQRKSLLGPVVERTPPVQPRPRPEPAVTISTRVVTPPKYREWIDRVPLIRSIQRNRYKGGDAFVPPRAAYQTTPRIPPRLARELQGDWRIEMRLSIAPDGLVRRIELLSPGAEPELADIAADAMGRWRFDPATLRGKPVSSEVVATLHYRNPVPENSLAQRR